MAPHEKTPIDHRRLMTGRRNNQIRLCIQHVYARYRLVSRKAFFFDVLSLFNAQYLSRSAADDIDIGPIVLLRTETSTVANFIKSGSTNRSNKSRNATSYDILCRKLVLP